MTNASSTADLGVQETDTPYGPLSIVASLAGLRAVLWQPAHSIGAKVCPGRRPRGAGSYLDEAARQLDQYFAGTRTRFDVRLDPQGTPFQMAVWMALERIPYGETRTYAQQAAHLGRPAAVRAVGAANGRNPLPIVLPCHRVIGSDGSLRGFAGGLDVKAALLAFESARGDVPASG